MEKFNPALLALQQATPTPAQSAAEIAAGLQRDLIEVVPRLFKGALILLVFWLVASVGRRMIAYTAPRVKADTSVVLLLSRLYYYGVLVFGAVTALGTTGLDVRALVAGLGLTGFALGFALKDVLSNFVSGVMLLAYRPFHIGDLIEMGEFVGEIETIRIRDTLVRAEDGRLIIIPNTKLITEVVVNHSDARRAGHAPADARAQSPPTPPRQPQSSPPPVGSPKRPAVRRRAAEEDEDGLLSPPPPPPPPAPE
ncbi:MAG TPA: mechanosensitive ion channel domain-containing protein [Pyrinomonadaceae bacterium]|nr:mechanosensitive ion channel domain-containing protein [Pyrinomonadaceae bacterium]